MAGLGGNLMEFWEKVSYQRVKYIVDSYELQGESPEDFHEYLEDLLLAYPSPQIELAIAETIVKSWLEIPLVKGMNFLVVVHSHLQSWEGSTQPTITSSQFKQITGLDPIPVFGACQLPINTKH